MADLLRVVTDPTAGDLLEVFATISRGAGRNARLNDLTDCKRKVETCSYFNILTAREIQTKQVTETCEKIGV